MSFHLKIYGSFFISTYGKSKGTVEYWTFGLVLEDTDGSPQIISVGWNNFFVVGIYILLTVDKILRWKVEWYKGLFLGISVGSIYFCMSIWLLRLINTLRRVQKKKLFEGRESWNEIFVTKKKCIMPHKICFLCS